MVKITVWGRLLLGFALLAGAPAGAQDGGGFVTYDQELAHLADEIPGFGGLFVDGERTHVYLTDLSYSERAQALAEGGVEVHQGDYDVRDLVAWKDELRPLLGRPGAVLLDLDERSNRLRLRVEAGAEPEIERALREVRVPRAAVILEVGDPFTPLEQLTDRIRPVPGGVRIRTSVGGCTLGVNVLRGGVRGFVTNSHCSTFQGLIDAAAFYQNTVATANLVGFESYEPMLFSGGACPGGRICRYSDATFVSYTSSTLGDNLAIANPLLCGISWPGPLTVDPADPRLEVTGGLFVSPPSGTLVTKVGSTTGCTFGAVQATCADLNVLNSNVTLLCQNTVGATSGSGDSGSPVFLNSGGKATVSGLLWGGAGGTYAYSTWAFVQGELGGLLLVP